MTPYERHNEAQHQNVTRYSPNGLDIIFECAECQLCFLFAPRAERPITIYRYPMVQARFQTIERKK